VIGDKGRKKKRKHLDAGRTNRRERSINSKNDEQITEEQCRIRVQSHV